MTARCWVVLPAAGVSRRIAGDTPKQYLMLLGRAVIEWSLAPFLARKDIDGAIVVVAADDSRFKTQPVCDDKRVSSVVGGAERAASVLRGVEALEALEVGANDWVLVHDAARPCLHTDDLSHLIATLATDEVGGLLAAPVAETLKAADADSRVQATLPRENLWRALTPQMFRFGLLLRALREASRAGRSVTDESAAVELLGLKPRLVTGRADNIKITVPEDLLQAEFILRQRSHSK